MNIGNRPLRHSFQNNIVVIFLKCKREINYVEHLKEKSHMNA